MAWKAANKTDLIIEVWEKLDCDSVGASEIEAIDVVIADTYGTEAVDPPMITARVLADEGAHLRHAEVMALAVRRARDRRNGPVFGDALNFCGLPRALSSIEMLEGLRSKLLDENDRHGLTAVREAAIRSKDRAVAKARSDSADARTREEQAEIAEWLRIWLQTPEVFSGWVALRRRSKDFQDKFGHI